MMSWLMERPSPVPSPAGLVVKNGFEHLLLNVRLNTGVVVADHDLHAVAEGAPTLRRPSASTASLCRPLKAVHNGARSYANPRPRTTEGCPRWVKSEDWPLLDSCSAWQQRPTFSHAIGMSAKGQYRLAAGASDMRCREKPRTRVALCGCYNLIVSLRRRSDAFATASVLVRAPNLRNTDST